jgi:hypothetical protein
MSPIAERADRYPRDEDAISTLRVGKGARAVAWFAVMGAESVAYHESTVLGREDDHPGRALDYYSSRGETPLRSGRAGSVTP